MTGPRHTWTLTDRETLALQLTAEGLSYKRVAKTMRVSLNTVHCYLERVRYKLDARNTTHAVALAWRKGLIR